MKKRQAPTETSNLDDRNNNNNNNYAGEQDNHIKQIQLSGASDPFSFLPTELLLYLLQFLPQTPHQLVLLRVLSKRWKECIQEEGNRLWKNLYIQRWGISNKEDANSYSFPQRGYTDGSTRRDSNTSSNSNISSKRNYKREEKKEEEEEEEGEDNESQEDTEVPREKKPKKEPDLFPPPLPISKKRTSKNNNNNSSKIADKNNDNNDDNNNNNNSSSSSEECQWFSRYMLSSKLEGNWKQAKYSKYMIDAHFGTVTSLAKGNIFNQLRRYIYYTINIFV